MAIGIAAGPALGQQESPYLYGIHDADPMPTEWLDHLAAGGTTGWVTATIAIGHDPTGHGGADFRPIANQDHTVICRINNGYCPEGTIPVPAQYENFAIRCADFVANTQGCNLFVIGNETNLPVEWPLRESSTWVSPQNYADCFRRCYQRIKEVRPDAQVISQPLAPWAGPYGPGTTCGHAHDGMGLNWVQYLNQMLSAIRDAGAGPDGIALHINSRGYTLADIHSTARVDAAGQQLYFSFYVYKDWINLGIPQDLYHLPLYATECNGAWYWKGGHEECTNPSDPSCSYQAGWVQEIYAEINRWNTTEGPLGKPMFRCINMYRWCAWCDPWNIDGDTNPKKGQILADLDDAVTQGYRWDLINTIDERPPGTNLSRYAADCTTSSNFGPEWQGENAIDGIVTSESKWTSANTAPPHWLALDLGGRYTINGYIIRMPGAVPEGDRYNAEAIMIQRSDSSLGPWHDEVIVNNPEQQSVIYKRYINPRALRYVRLRVIDPGIDNIARIQEFEVVGVAPQPAAAFTAIPHAGEAPLQVQFTNLSLGPVDDYAWSFGDGGASTASDPPHIYFDGGHYTVSLTVTGPGGSNTMTKTDYIDVAEPTGYIGDFDNDDDVDQADFGYFQACMTGPGTAVTNPACFKVMLDNDNDIDMDDFGLFQECMSGADLPPPTPCLR